MKKILSGFISILLCFMLMWSLIPVTAFAEDDEDPAAGMGDSAMDPVDEDAVYEINNTDDLFTFAALVNSGYTKISAVLGSDITLNKDLLDADGKLTSDTADLISWIPIGDSNDTAFEGEFDGAGFTIRGLYMDTEDALGGLFGVLKGLVKNLRIEDSWIESARDAGAIAAWNQGTIQNVSFDGHVGSGNTAGGITGINEGDISRCYTTGTVEEGDAIAVGPVCGVNAGTIDEAFYLAEEETDDLDDTEAMNADQFASGELCWRLNQGLDAPIFFQNLGDDDAPVLNDTHGEVYCGYTSCADEDPVYGNETLSEERPPHILTAHEGTDIDCSEGGSKAYWSCEGCGKYFEDAEGTIEIEEDSWIIPAAGHTLTAHEAVEPTCTEKGSSAYWSCEVCGKYFSDAEGTTEISEDSWLLPALDHDFVNGTCTRCGEKDGTEPETQPSSEEADTQAPSAEPETKPSAEPETKSTATPETQPSSAEPATQPTAVPQTQPTAVPQTQPTVMPTVPTVPTSRETDPVPVTMPEPNTVAPTAPTEYMISISDDGHGHASANPAFASTGVTVTLTATPNDGYRFKEWQVLSGGVKITGDKFTVGYDNVEIKVLFEKTPDAPPSIIGGNGSMWVEGSDTSVKITSDGDYYSFTDLKVDGSVIAKKNYTATAGSVIVELKPDYLNTLEEGRHNVTFVFGQLESDEGWFLVVAQKENPVSKINVILWIIVIAAALSVIATTIILLSGRKKNREEDYEDY